MENTSDHGPAEINGVHLMSGMIEDFTDQDGITRRVVMDGPFAMQGVTIAWYVHEGRHLKKEQPYTLPKLHNLGDTVVIRGRWYVVSGHNLRGGIYMVGVTHAKVKARTVDPEPAA